MTFVVDFENGDPKRKDLLGGKGAGLADMTQLGIPVPPGFIVTTEACTAYHRAGRKLPAGLMDEVRAAVDRVGAKLGVALGDATRPLLLSVRSGARVSMPGMMDTILNLGLNDATVASLAAENPRFAWDCYRRFVSMFGDVVMGLKPATEADADPFDQILEQKRAERGVQKDVELSADDLKDLVKKFKGLLPAFPHDPWEQLERSIAAVFESWDNPRARTYRAMYGYPSEWGTAVNVQAMVFGNMGDDCATGVAFTRDPATGDNIFYGEFLPNAQGEDVVAGIRTPQPIAELERLLPEAYHDLLDVRDRLEAHFRDMQDIEFTVQRGKLWMLQTRTGKRTGRAMVKVAVDLVREGMIGTRDAILRLDASKIDELLHPMVDPDAVRDVVATGLPASPGAAVGRIVFTAGAAQVMADKGDSPILVRVETSPEDIHGMKVAVGILTQRGGMTSHAAVVARGMGKCCIVGASSIQVDARGGTLRAGGRTFRAGDVLTLDGTRGEVMAGAVPLVPARQGPELKELLGWVDAARRLHVRTNADTPVDARTARAFGAEGIGLCRTEHMFFDPERLLAFRQMILASDEKGRRAALAKILPMQRDDFIGIFRAMDGLPVTVRLLDPPLHEFLPKTDQELLEVAQSLGVSVDAVRALNARHAEQNPMLGHRGCRLAVTYPEIYETQVQAVAEAAVAVARAGVVVVPEIMIPIVGLVGEIARMRELVTRAFDAVLTAEAFNVPYTVGTMIELPRACVVAGGIAAHADFFSFGTNDLTQTTFGFSRDDIGHFLPVYLEQQILPHDPFVTVDRDGVGALVAMAVERGRAVKPGLKMGVCGEHGGDPASVELFHNVGCDYVSCSPFRVPIARVAAAQAALRTGNPT
jgi:pyruvate,orthophosphate dikinase